MHSVLLLLQRQRFKDVSIQSTSKEQHKCSQLNKQLSDVLSNKTVASREAVSLELPNEPHHTHSGRSPEVCYEMRATPYHKKEAEWQVDELLITCKAQQPPKAFASNTVVEGGACASNADPFIIR